MSENQLTDEQIELFKLLLWQEADASFDEREKGLIQNCILYAHSKPSGLPGHNLMIIVSKLSAMVGIELDVE